MSFLLPVRVELDLRLLFLGLWLLGEADVLPGVEAGHPVEGDAGEVVAVVALRVAEVDLLLRLLDA